MNDVNARTIYFIIVFFTTTYAYSPVALSQQPLSLAQAIEHAINNDPWLHGSKLTQAAITAKSVASGTLPNPKVSIGMLNMPTDNWNFKQEGMTQFKVGVSQMFSRGKELEIKQAQLEVEATQFPLLRDDRKAKLTRNVSQLWLDTYLAQQTITLIEHNRELFTQMVELAQASYAAGLDKTKQQDVIRAQLELFQLEDRLTLQHQKLATSKAQLGEWLYLYDENNVNDGINFDNLVGDFAVESFLPDVSLTNKNLLEESIYSRTALVQIITRHPAIKAITVKHKVAKQSISLAREKYKSQWGVNASYAYRDDMLSGDNRADLFSVGVSFDLPLFTKNRQDKQLIASVAKAEAVQTDKLLATKRMLSNLEKELMQLRSLTKRKNLYTDHLLAQSNEQAEATLTAYTNDDGFFSDVVRARISELNTKILALEIDINRLKTISRINYFLPASEHIVSNATGHY